MKLASIYRRHAERRNQDAGKCRCGRERLPGFLQCATCHAPVNVSVRAEMADLVRKRALRTDRTMRAVLDEIVRERLKRMEAG